MSGTLTYNRYLRLDELLSLQAPVAPEPADAERLFIVTHQAHELWFGVLLDSLEQARDDLEANRVARAAAPLGRAIAVQRLLTAHTDPLETLTVGEFARFRGHLGTASGAQSARFHEVVFLSGVKDAALTEAEWLTPDERGRLGKRLGEPTVWDGYVTALRRHFPGADSPDGVVAALSELAYATDGDDDAGADPTGLWATAELLRSYDRAAAEWRQRHVQLVEGHIGDRPGTGGSAGAAYLRGRTHRHYFPLLWGL